MSAVRNTQAHARIASLFLEQGIPVYVDKALAYTLDEATAMVELAENRGVLLMTCFRVRRSMSSAKSGAQH